MFGSQTPAGQGGFTAPAPRSGDSSIKLKVIGPDSSEIDFRVNYETPMGQLMKNYATRNGVSVDTIRFLFDGLHIRDEHTPRSLGLREDDVIEVFEEMVGGELIK
ncbi:unnamed protein product [Enterobius vermicularis]|uniref:Small ubiquitin-related modifier n=1 Tax=Enterobius vermicularis TaxID=51028 RepID=A0A0N4VJP3_ENTVE|nr:unnamed protein product [Enterobius vermicularis]